MALSSKTEEVRQRGPDTIRARLDRLTAEYSELPVSDDRSADDLLGYDDAGLPTCRP